MKMDVEILPVKMIDKKCLKCGAEFIVDPYTEQDFCIRCFHIVCKAVFDESNSKLTCKQLIEKLQGE